LSFGAFVQDLDPRYCVPSRKLLSLKIFPDKYKAIETKLLAILDNASIINITLDIWSNRQMESYIGILVHFIYKWKLHCLMLS
uniref:HAT C-terminal dimerisation domain-containing protein n=1 Tax=Amphimedon queenslandica TaxID=400682 RepID=A0A1X7V948_AMPQE